MNTTSSEIRIRRRTAVGLMAARGWLLWIYFIVLLCAAAKHRGGVTSGG
ncbi:MAG: hypothetical protein ACREPK_00490 [Rhodanobacteraceae bacterium]